MGSIYKGGTCGCAANTEWALPEAARYGSTQEKGTCILLRRVNRVDHPRVEVRHWAIVAGGIWGGRLVQGHGIDEEDHHWSAFPDCGGPWQVLA